jgi:hypothetical protein
MKPRGIGLVAGHVRRNGLAKISYETREDALERCGHAMKAYRCDLCGKWHLAREKKSK